MNDNFLISEEYKMYSAIALRKFEKELKDWDWIDMLGQSSEQELEELLATHGEINGFYISAQQWHFIVNHVKHDVECRVDLKILPPSIIPLANNNNFTVDTSKGSSWSSYKTVLNGKKFSQETINMIEQSSINILNKLSLDTVESGPIKGLVIGNVQSGKTANMAALMAMAADQGWNFFIVLSGTIENLRIQTQDRLINDLKSATNVTWTPLDNVTNSYSSTQQLSYLHLNENDTSRYLMVCLKNSTRLKNLLLWLNKDKKNREKLKILFIDDEADQAGINATSKITQLQGDPDDIERTAINRLIVNMLNNKDDLGEPCEKKFKSLNYVAYTATPYANILNENPGPNSIYPEHFVACLGVSPTYFGPQQIFGLSSENIDGLNIINTVSNEEIKKIKKIDKEVIDFPSGLEESILWFFCCFAIRKLRNEHKPVSMLIHTNQKQAHHEAMADLIKRWFSRLDSITFIKKCEKVYKEQINKFTLNDFENGYSKYALMHEVKDYPKFEEISNRLAELFNYGLTSILIDDSQEPQFNKGVHLCIDNCSKHYGDNANEHIRLLYPKNQLDYTTGFIVIGGATLSRGLTIEGLVSTYFVRTVNTADTLMQMGRWFGYRVGYELLQRIWMDKDTQDKFDFLSVMDYELRQKMKYMEINNISPRLVGISILQYVNKKIEITAKNKKKAAVVLDMEFSGLVTQTTMFFNDEEILKSNLRETTLLIQNLNSPVQSNNHIGAEATLLWNHVSNETVINYIKSLKFPKGDSKFLDVDLFEKWYEDLINKGELIDWNVAVSGASDKKKITVGDKIIHTVNRSKKTSDHNDGIIRIGALRAPKDLYVDIDICNGGLEKSDIDYIKNAYTADYQSIRNKAGLNKTSLLVIYVIDKDSQPKAGDKGKREPMNTPVDVVGVAVVIPGRENETSDENVLHVGLDLSALDDAGESGE